MTQQVDPFVYPIPRKFLADPELRAYFEYFHRWAHDMWKRTGGGDDAISELQIGELYEIGIDSFDPLEIDSGEFEVSGEALDRIEDLEGRLGSVDFSLLERLEELEVDQAFTGAQTNEFAQLDIVAVTSNFTSTGSQIIVCANTSPITITLNSSPGDGEEVQIKRRDALVTLSGTIDGSSTIILPNKYDAIRLVYYDSGSEWMIM